MNDRTQPSGTAASSLGTASSDLPWSDRRILVTGGAGFIGANVVRAIIAAGCFEVTVYDDLSTGRAANLDGLDVEIIVGSVEDVEVVDKVAEKADAIVHLAAQGSVAVSVDRPQYSNAVNVTGTLNVLEAARASTTRDQAAHVILASSAAIYGTDPTLPKHELMAPRAASPYAASKIAMEEYAFAHQRSFDVPVLVPRFFNVYGPYQPADHAYAPVIPAFISRALAGESISIHGDGHQTRDFVFVETVADLIVDAIDRGVTSTQPMNVASGTSVSLLEVLHTLELQLNTPLDRDHQPPRQGDIPHSAADISTLAQLFPDLVPTPFNEGIRRTIAWWREQGPQPR